MSKSSCGGYVPPEYALKWEAVAKELDRVPVDGGFIYRTIAGSYSAPAMVFVPTPSKTIAIRSEYQVACGTEIRGDRQVARSVVADITYHFCSLCEKPDVCKADRRCARDVGAAPVRQPVTEDLGRCNAMGCNAPAVHKLEGGWRFCTEHNREHNPRAGVTVSTTGDKHEGCPKGGTWRETMADLVDRCDGCGEERA